MYLESIAGRLLNVSCISRESSVVVDLSRHIRGFLMQPWQLHKNGALVSELLFYRFLVFRVNLFPCDYELSFSTAKLAGPNPVVLHFRFRHK